MPATEVYEKIKADFERLERENASRSDWIIFANRLVDAVMKCQAIVIEHQKRMIAQTRSGPDTDEYKATRQASKDAIQILDSLSALHERTRAKLLP